MIGHTGRRTRALYSEENYAHDTTQAPYEILNIRDGRALWRVNGQVVGDHYGPTTRNNRPIDFIMLTQIYGDANPKYQWIDDIEIWDGLPE